MLFKLLRNGRNNSRQRKSSLRSQGLTSRRLRSAPLSLERLEERTLLSAVPIPNDSNSLLLLRFEDFYYPYYVGENGEEPVFVGDGVSGSAGLIGGALDQQYSGNLTYENAGNILSTRGTVEFWFDPRGSEVFCTEGFCPPAWDGNDGKFHPFFEAGDNSNNSMLIEKDASNNLRFTQWGDDPTTPAVEVHVERSIATSAADVHPGRWYHIAATWDGATRQMAFYVDGQLRGSRSDGVVINQFSPVLYNGDPATASFVLSVGWEQENGQNAGLPQCQGCAAPAAAPMDEFRISDRARTATEIRNDYDLGVGVTDFGDAPLPYPTLLAENGAEHLITGPTLGANRDTESNGTHSVSANADDTTGVPDDEDGVTFGTLMVGALGATATVNVQNAPSGAKLDAWLDFNGDGSGAGRRSRSPAAWRS